MGQGPGSRSWPAWPAVPHWDKLHADLGEPGREARHQRQFRIEAGDQHVDVFGIVNFRQPGEQGVRAAARIGKQVRAVAVFPAMQAGIEGVVAEADDPDAFAAGFASATARPAPGFSGTAFMPVMATVSRAPRFT